MKPGDAVFLAEALHFPLQEQFGLALLVVQDLDIDKAVAASPAGADGLEEGLFGGEPGGEILGALGLRFTVGNLPGGKNPLFQAFCPAELLFYALDFDDVRADAENQETTSLKKKFYYRVIP